MKTTAEYFRPPPIPPIFFRQMPEMLWAAVSHRCKRSVVHAYGIERAVRFCASQTMDFWFSAVATHLFKLPIGGTAHNAPTFWVLNGQR